MWTRNSYSKSSCQMTACWLRHCNRSALARAYNPVHHYLVEYFRLVPSSQLTDPPAIDPMAQRHPMSQTRKLGLHGCWLWTSRSPHVPSMQLPGISRSAKALVRCPAAGALRISAERNRSRRRPSPRHRPSTRTTAAPCSRGGSCAPIPRRPDRADRPGGRRACRVEARRMSQQSDS